MAHNNLGFALMAEGRSDEAMAHWRRAVEINPDFAEADHNLGLAAASHGHFDEAVSLYRKALKTGPDDARIHNNLGVALYTLGLPEEAIAEYRKALELEADFTEAHCNLGNALAAAGELDQALSHYQEATRIKPDNRQARDNLLAVTTAGAASSGGGRTQQQLAANRDDVTALNELAWLRASCPFKSLRNGAEQWQRRDGQTGFAAAGGWRYSIPWPPPTRRRASFRTPSARRGRLCGWRSNSISRRWWECCGLTSLCTRRGSRFAGCRRLRQSSEP